MDDINNNDPIEPTEPSEEQTDTGSEDNGSSNEGESPREEEAAA